MYKYIHTNLSHSLSKKSLWLQHKSWKGEISSISVYNVSDGSGGGGGKEKHYANVKWLWSRHHLHKWKLILQNH